MKSFDEKQQSKNQNDYKMILKNKLKLISQETDSDYIYENLINGDEYSFEIVFNNINNNKKYYYLKIQTDEEIEFTDDNKYYFSFQREGKSCEKSLSNDGFGIYCLCSEIKLCELHLMYERIKLLKKEIMVKLILLFEYISAKYYRQYDYSDFFPFDNYCNMFFASYIININHIIILKQMDKFYHNIIFHNFYPFFN